jgi:hypothetical protein
VEIRGIYDNGGTRCYEMRGEMNTAKFVLLANRLAAAFDVVPKLFWMPEADVATSPFPTVEFTPSTIWLTDWKLRALDCPANNMRASKKYCWRFNLLASCATTERFGWR